MRKWESAVRFLSARSGRVFMPLGVLELLSLLSGCWVGGGGALQAAAGVEFTGAAAVCRRLFAVPK